MQNNISEIALDPKDISVEFFYYRKHGKIIRKLVIHHKGEKYFAYDKIVNQFFRYLSIGYREAIAIKDWRERNKVINQKLKDTKTTLVLSVTPEHKIIRIASSEFTPIPHRYIINSMRTILANRYEKEKIDTSWGMFAYWILKSEDSVVKWLIWVHNRNDAAHSLKIGAGFNTQFGNAIKYTGDECIKLIHRGDFDRLYSDMVKAIRYLDKCVIPKFRKLVEESREKSIDFDVVLDMIDKFPEWIRASIKSKLFKVKTPTLWDVSKIMQMAANMDGVTPRQRIQLMDMGIRVLYI